MDFLKIKIVYITFWIKEDVHLRQDCILLICNSVPRPTKMHAYFWDKGIGWEVPLKDRVIQTVGHYPSPWLNRHKFYKFFYHRFYLIRSVGNGSMNVMGLMSFRGIRREWEWVDCWKVGPSGPYSTGLHMQYARRRTFSLI